MSLATIQYACKTQMVDLRAVGIVGEAQLEASRVEVLIHAGCVEPVVSDSAREVKVEVLHTEVVRLVIELTAELLLTQLAERRHSISNVAGLDGTLRRSHKVGAFQRSVAAPVGRELVHGRRVNGRQSVLVYRYVFARQSDLNLARFVGVRSVEHHVALFLLLRFRIVC